MAIKKNTYISVDLEWAESKLQEWKDYIDANPFHQLKDRIEWKPTSKGGMLPMVIATIESQIKCVRDTMKEYLAMLEVVDKLRAVEEREKRIQRGGKDIPESMEDNDL